MFSHWVVNIVDGNSYTRNIINDSGTNRCEILRDRLRSCKKYSRNALKPSSFHHTYTYTIIYVYIESERLIDIFPQYLLDFLAINVLLLLEGSLSHLGHISLLVS